MDLITCIDCGGSAPRRGPMQKYCEPCSEKRDLTRKRIWSSNNPLTKAQIERRRENRQQDKSRVIGIWTERNQVAANTIGYWPEVELAWLIRIAVPFSYNLSKNAIFTSTKWGHVALRRESRACRDEITQLLREAVRDIKPKQNKLWVDIYVQKPNHRGDAVNVVDLVCDAVKDAIGIDDRWFCIRRIDWQIVKDEPRLFIGIGQEECVDSKVCSYCGLIMGAENFGKNSRECRECKRAKRKRPQ